MILLYWRSKVHNVCLWCQQPNTSFSGGSRGPSISLLSAAAGGCLHYLACGPLPASKLAVTSGILNCIAPVLTPLPLFLAFQNATVILLGPTGQSRIISSLQELVSSLQSICNLNSFFTR